MSNNSVPIVVIAYNRPKSLLRLLSSLAKANYSEKNIPLIISIDYSETNKDVLQIANDFEWRYGKKNIVYSEFNLGLKEHVLQCGNYSLEYGNVILLEDDLYVSPCFYDYTLQALEFSIDKSYIGGISLYNHQCNVHKIVNFTALSDGYDNWYFQFASSWGQAWSKSHWEDFIAWYLNQGIMTPNSSIPKNITDWSEKSWLKYFISYLVDKNKYFLYPQVSLSTNFSDQGTHANKDSTSYQVPLLLSANKKFHFSNLEESHSIYNVFFENLKLYDYLGYNNKDLCIDLNGYITDYSKPYILTTQKLNFEILKSYGRSLKPIEANVIFDIPGNDIFLYDSKKNVTNNNPENRYREIIYNIKQITLKNALYLVIYLSKNKVISILKKLLNK